VSIFLGQRTQPVSLHARQYENQNDKRDQLFHVHPSRQPQSGCRVPLVGTPTSANRKHTPVSLQLSVGTSAGATGCLSTSAASEPTIKTQPNHRRHAAVQFPIFDAVNAYQMENEKRK